MQIEKFPSKALQNTVEELAKLPGIGKRTALRLSLHMLRQDKSYSENLGNSILNLKAETKQCRVCGNISDNDYCNICSDEKRDKSLICVVETIIDVIAIENTRQYSGVYHLLGGLISPLDGIGPGDLNIQSLINRIESGSVKEVILALSTTMEGDTTNFYIYKKINEFNILISSIARGVSIGDELEYTDEITLGRSLLNRVKFDGMIR